MDHFSDSHGIIEEIFQVKWLCTYEHHELIHHVAEVIKAQQTFKTTCKSVNPVFVNSCFEFCCVELINAYTLPVSRYTKSSVMGLLQCM